MHYLFFLIKLIQNTHLMTERRREQTPGAPSNRSQKCEATRKHSFTLPAAHLLGITTIPGERRAEGRREDT